VAKLDWCIESFCRLSGLMREITEERKIKTSVYFCVRGVKNKIKCSIKTAK